MPAVSVPSAPAAPPTAVGASANLRGAAPGADAFGLLVQEAAATTDTSAPPARPDAATPAKPHSSKTAPARHADAAPAPAEAEPLTGQATTAAPEPQAATPPAATAATEDQEGAEPVATDALDADLAAAQITAQMAVPAEPVVVTSAMTLSPTADATPTTDPVETETASAGTASTPQPKPELRSDVEPAPKPAASPSAAVVAAGVVKAAEIAVEAAKMVAPPPVALAAETAEKVVAAAAALLAPAKPEPTPTPSGPASANPAPTATAPLAGTVEGAPLSVQAKSLAPAKASIGEAAAPSASPNAAQVATQIAAQTPDAAAVADAAAAKPATPAVIPAVAETPAPAASTLEAVAAPVAHAVPVADAGGSTVSTLPNLSGGLAHVAVETTAQLAAQIARRLEGRSTRFEMALTPDDLGRVDVSLDIDADGALSARLAFDNPLAATELRGRADELRRQLQDAGFTVGSDSLSFSEREAGSSGGGFDRRFDQGAGRAFAGASRLNAETETAVLPPVWASLSQTPQGVDLKV